MRAEAISNEYLGEDERVSGGAGKSRSGRALLISSTPLLHSSVEAALTLLRSFAEDDRRRAP